MKNEGIQLFRTLLFFGIVLFHCGVNGSALLWGGIESFFLLSSYFLSKKLLKKDNVCVLEEFKSRLKRLYPMYLITIILVFFIVATIKKRFAFDELIVHCIFLQNFYWMVYSKSSIFMPFSAHTWTLGIEIWLFLVWVVAFKYIKNIQKRKIFNIIMICIAIGYRIIAIELKVDALVLSLFPLGHLDAFAVGSLIALDRDKENESSIKSVLICMIGGMLIISSIIVTSRIYQMGIVAAYDLYKDSVNYFNNIFTGNIYAYILLLSAGLVKICLKLEHVHIHFFKQLAKIGAYTYGGYLLHWPIRTLLLYFVSGNIIIAIFVAVISIIGAYILEKGLKKLFDE